MIVVVTAVGAAILKILLLFAVMVVVFDVLSMQTSYYKERYPFETDRANAGYGCFITVLYIVVVIVAAKVFL